MWTLHQYAISLLAAATALAVVGTAGAHSFESSAAVPAVSFTLDIEFDDGITGSFADVEVYEEGYGLRFDIVLREALGLDADLREFYFNLTDDVPSLRIEPDDPLTTGYVLSVAGPVGGGAGSRFDYGVSFGNGAGPSGYGVLRTASFLVESTGSDPLYLDALLNARLSAASGGSILVNAAAHIQGTSLVWGASSETIGGTVTGPSSVPEPSTGMLLAIGLLLAIRSSRLGKRSESAVASASKKWIVPGKKAFLIAATGIEFRMTEFFAQARR